MGNIYIYIYRSPFNDVKEDVACSSTRGTLD